MCEFSIVHPLVLSSFHHRRRRLRLRPRKLFAPAATLGWCEDKRNAADVWSPTTTEGEKIYRATARQTSPTFFLILQRNGKVVAAVKRNTVFRAAASCCYCTGSKVRLQAKEEQQQMLFSRFQLRETHSRLSHTADVVQMADLIQNAFSIVFRVSVFLPSEHT